MNDESILRLTEEHYIAQSHLDAKKRIEKLTDKEQVSLFRGITQIYEIFLKAKEQTCNNPKDKLLAFFPWRGSGPIYYMLDELAKMKGMEDGLSEFVVVSTPPVGTAMDINSPGRNVGGIEDGQKKTIIYENMKTIFDQTPYGLGLVNNIQGIIVLDEVQKGGTMTRFLTQLDNAREKLLKDDGIVVNVPLFVISAQDEANFGVQRKRKYLELQNSQNTDKFKFSAVNLPMFVDVDSVLPLILELNKDDSQERATTTDDSKLSIGERRESWKNPNAEEEFRKFIREYYENHQE